MVSNPKPMLPLLELTPCTPWMPKEIQKAPMEVTSHPEGKRKLSPRT